MNCNWLTAIFYQQQLFYICGEKQKDSQQAKIITKTEQHEIALFSESHLHAYIIRCGALLIWYDVMRCAVCLHSLEYENCRNCTNVGEAEAIILLQPYTYANNKCRGGITTPKSERHAHAKCSTRKSFHGPSILQSSICSSWPNNSPVPLHHSWPRCSVHCGRSSAHAHCMCKSAGDISGRHELREWQWWLVVDEENFALPHEHHGLTSEFIAVMRVISCTPSTILLWAVVVVLVVVVMMMMVAHEHETNSNALQTLPLIECLTF